LQARISEGHIGFGASQKRRYTASQKTMLYVHDTAVNVESIYEVTGLANF
jgi:hypothetical protein